LFRCADLISRFFIIAAMLVRAFALVFMLMVVQLALGLFVLFSESGEEFVMAHTGLGLLIYILLFGATFSSRRAKHPAAGDITLTAFLYTIQGALGLTSMLGGSGGEAAGAVHLYFSLLVVATAAAALVLAAESQERTETRLAVAESRPTSLS